MNNKYNELDAMQKYFHQKMNLVPIIGAEIEFYLGENADIQKLEQLINCHIKTEKGQNQFEIEFPPTDQLVHLSVQIEQTRDQIINFAIKNNLFVSFQSKPFINDFGNSLHVHLNFQDHRDIEKYAVILCHYLADYIDYCLPNKSDYQRLDHKFMAPTHVCWGGNNRSVMIRIPDSQPKRLEHRLPSAECDPSLVFTAILKVIKDAQDKSLDLKQFAKIYGNAFDPQYNLKKISNYRKDYLILL